MLYMVIERFRDNDLEPVGERFRTHGRLMPEGVTYVASWLEPTAGQRDAQDGRCFQIVESPSRGLLQKWMDEWSDLVDFEVIPVLTSADFWASRPAR